MEFYKIGRINVFVIRVSLPVIKRKWILFFLNHNKHNTNEFPKTSRIFIVYIHRYVRIMYTAHDAQTGRIKNKGLTTKKIAPLTMILHNINRWRQYLSHLLTNDNLRQIITISYIICIRNN